MTRATAALAAFALVVGSWLAGWHRVAVQHVVCAEHGEEVELPSADGVDHHGDASGPQLERGPAVPAHDDEHHHCQILAALHQPALPGGDEVVVAALFVWHEVPPPSVTRTDIGDRAVYRLAPKTSPPV